MNVQSKKFIKFNGKTIHFLAVDGQYWIAIKPICEALNVNYDRQFKNLKTHKCFSQLYALQPMTGADSKVYKMVCLSEKYIYGWIFQVRSDSEALAAYQIECCNILYDHFHGIITGRAEVLTYKNFLQKESKKLATKLNQNEDFKRLQKLEAAIMRSGKTLKELDNNLLREVAPEIDFTKQS